MKSGVLTVLAAGMAALIGSAASAEPAPSAASASLPAQLTPMQRTEYRAVFAAVDAGRWADAQLALDAMAPGPLHAYARARLYTAKGSPKVEPDALARLIAEAPELPQAPDLMRLAQARGLTNLPPLPAQQRLVWQDGAPARVRAKPTKSDEIASILAVQMQPFVKTDQAAAAEALLSSTPGLTMEATTEWQARIAWIYFLQGFDKDARRLAATAAEGAGDWATQARWTGALAAWRQQDCGAMGSAFEGVAARAADIDLRATALFWASRADMACGRPDHVQAHLTGAAQFGETFYGLLARQALGIAQAPNTLRRSSSDWALIERRPNVRVAAALAEIGESDDADTVIRQQARIGSPVEFAALTRVTEAMDMPSTVVWLAHNMPQGVAATPDTRYPMPNWTPDSGWRVDRALVFAHALQESNFRNKVKSPAGAYGLMQIMPAAATDYSRERGLALDTAALSRPSTNMDVGQRHIERLRDMSATGGLLPKVIAAYNAGPKPVGEWNAIVRDGGDPLLYIESIPYWETRGYVVTVLRNYWMYEGQAGRRDSASRAALAQGMWPRFPGLPGASAVRLNNRAASSAIAVATPVPVERALTATAVPGFSTDPSSD